MPLESECGSNANTHRHHLLSKQWQPNPPTAAGRTIMIPTAIESIRADKSRSVGLLRGGWSPGRPRGQMMIDLAFGRFNDVISLVSSFDQSNLERKHLKGVESETEHKHTKEADKISSEGRWSLLSFVSSPARWLIRFCDSSGWLLG